MARQEDDPIGDFYAENGYTRKRSKESADERANRIRMALYGSQYFADGGLVSLVRRLAKKHGSFQAQRAEQAADLIDTSKFDTKSFERMFGDPGTGLYMTMRPGDFETYARPIRQIAQDQNPYLRWGSVPRRDVPKAPGAATFDAYVDNIAKLINDRGMYDAPTLWLAKGNKKLPEVEGHEGRHRMRALGRMGEDAALVRLAPANAGEGRGTAEEVVERMLGRYFPRGDGSDRVWPEQSSLLGRSQVTWPSVPFADGGAVESLQKLLGKLRPKGSGYVPPVGGGPATVKIPGLGEVEARPLPEAMEAAEKYMRSRGLEHDIGNLSPINTNYAREVAGAFNRMPNDPSNPAVRRAYDAMIDETMDQYRALRNAGYEFKFHTPTSGDPYARSPSLGYADLANNGRLWVYPTLEGFGSGVGDSSLNPLLIGVGKVGDLNNATANDAFRVVHDMFGHFGPGNPFFRAPGEERAYQLHSRMYGPEARRAAATETRGQNSWVNFGPYAHANRGASGADTVYAPQTVNLLPDWATSIGGDWWYPGKTEFADGGAVRRGIKKLISAYRDPPSTIDAWKWRPLEEVAKEVPTEVPPHVLEFGDYMDRMSRKADVEGLSPRDILKAYTTTLSSIQRGAANRDKLPGLRLTSDEQMIRPEGAFSDWLGGAQGQKYLRYGAEGEAHPEAIADAMTHLRPFGLMPTLGERMAAAPGIVADTEGRLSELIGRARRGDSAPEEWREAVEPFVGIGPSKAGFLASLMGRGDIPTLDARQIILHTGRPTKESRGWLRRQEGIDAVDRLAARQKALDLFMPFGMRPFDQHLTHHTIWDAVGNEKTTHADVMDMMLNRATGGYVPLKTGTTETMRRLMRQMLKKEPPTERRILDQYSEITGRSPEELAEALRTKNAGVKKYGDVQTVRGISDRPGTGAYDQATAGMMFPDLGPRPVIDLEKLVGPNSWMVGGMSDRASAGPTIYSIGGARVPTFVTPGGSDYPWLHEPLWVGQRNALKSLVNAPERAGVGKDAELYFTNKLMGLQSLDQTHMAMDAAAAALQNASVSKKDRKTFDNMVRSVTTSIPRTKEAPTGTITAMPDFPGSASESLGEYLNNQSMVRRGPLLRVMDSRKALDMGFPGGAPIRLALTDPNLIVHPEGTTGRTIGRIDRDAPYIEKPRTPHGSYPTGLAGEWLGGTDRPIPPDLMFPDFFAGKPRFEDTPSLRRSFMVSPVLQRLDNRWLDNLMQGLEERGIKPGWADGGLIKQLVLPFRKQAWNSQKKWTEGSATVNSRGQPKTFYHATSAPDFEAFEVGRPQTYSHTFGPYESSNSALFFAETPELANYYARNGDRYKEGARIMPVHLQARNPIDLREGIPYEVDRYLKDNLGLNSWLDFKPTDVWQAFEQETGGDDFVRALRGMGYDSARMIERVDDNTKNTSSWAVFDPRQVKSIFNRGSYDPTDPNLLRARGGAV